MIAETTTSAPETEPVEEEVRRDTRRRYPCDCAYCGYTFHACKSLMMDMNINRGSGKCPECHCYLTLRMDPDLGGFQMLSELPPDYVQPFMVAAAMQDRISYSISFSLWDDKFYVSRGGIVGGCFHSADEMAMAACDSLETARAVVRTAIGEPTVCRNRRAAEFPMIWEIWQ